MEVGIRNSKTLISALAAVVALTMVALAPASPAEGEVPHVKGSSGTRHTHDHQEEDVTQGVCGANQQLRQVAPCFLAEYG